MKLPILLLLALSLLLHSCTPEQDCPPTRTVVFRDIEMAFPMTGSDVYESRKDIYFRNGLLSTSNTLFERGQNTIIWFPERGDFPSPPQDTILFLRERKIYGITFFLKEERNLTDREMAEKVKKELNLKNDFVLKTKPGRSFYHYQEGCLSIITSMLDDNGPYPQVSFCYGLKENELFYYATGPGNISSD